MNIRRLQRQELTGYTYFSYSGSKNIEYGTLNDGSNEHPWSLCGTNLRKISTTIN